MTIIAAQNLRVAVLYPGESAVAPSAARHRQPGGEALKHRVLPPVLGQKRAALPAPRFDVPTKTTARRI